MANATTRIQASPNRKTPPNIALAAVLLSAILLAGERVDAATTMFLANLNAAQQTPPNASVGMGNAFLHYDAVTRMLCYDVVHANLAGAEILAHIHGPALPDVGGAPILFPLPVANPKNGCVGPLASDQKRDLYRNLWYVDIHTTASPGGELRGQILRVK
ncbi:MAG TPA: CHRD domain-containing protein [Candidatus Binatia bacterium]|nr:CHRD domain-containing protein [Candidatus Binatia bacterium]